jgi:hypothetical protein
MSFLTMMISSVRPSGGIIKYTAEAILDDHGNSSDVSSVQIRAFLPPVPGLFWIL